MVRWIADETNFPNLCRLYLSNCRSLEEIPSSIGEIPTLQLIEVKYCTESVVASAERIVEEQSENGNEDLRLSITKQFRKGNKPFLQLEYFQCCVVSATGD